MTTHLAAIWLLLDCPMTVAFWGGESLWTSNCGHSSHCGHGGCFSSRRWCGTSSTGLACVEEDVDPLLTVMIQSAVRGGWCSLRIESDGLVSSAWPRTWRRSGDYTARCPPCMTQIWLNGDYSGAHKCQCGDLLVVHAMCIYPEFLLISILFLV
jgi:hypothetical protein